MPDSRAELDDRLVEALREEPRATVLSLADSTGFPRAVVATRLKELLEAGDLKIVAATHPYFVQDRVKCHVSVKVRGETAEVVEFLQEMPETVFLSAVTGEYSLVTEVRAKSIDELHELLGKIRTHPSVASINSLYYSRVYKSYITDKDFSDTTIDDTDRQLLQALSVDARMTWQDLGAVVGLSPSAVRTRVNRILDSGIARVVVMQQRSRHGSTIMLGLGLSLSTDIESVADELRALPGVEFVVGAVGRYDVLLVMHALTAVEAAGLLENIRQLEWVEQFDSWAHLRLLKQDFTRVL